MISVSCGHVVYFFLFIFFQNNINYYGMGQLNVKLTKKC
jgi:hypothetical protein